jgi:hypothetical protein
MKYVIWFLQYLQHYTCCCIILHVAYSARIDSTSTSWIISSSRSGGTLLMTQPCPCNFMPIEQGTCCARACRQMRSRMQRERLAWQAEMAGCGVGMLAWTRRAAVASLSSPLPRLCPPPAPLSARQDGRDTETSRNGAGI